MPELKRALADIHAIRGQIAVSTQFRGYGPASVAASGVLALAVAGFQTRWFDLRWHGVTEPDMRSYLAVWVGVAAVAVLLTALETLQRARRVHSDLANEMIQRALEQFVPALMSGALLTVVMLRFSPHNLWMLPGLWQIIFSLGVFASCRFLPRQMFVVGVWYLSAGLACIALSGLKGTCSPWTMGIPFGVGQLLVAGILQFGFRGEKFA
jgi:hypothetical protein